MGQGVACFNHPARRRHDGSERVPRIPKIAPMDEPDFLAKCVAPDLAAAALQALRARGPVVFTNGVFDVLHRGHVTYLAQARRLGGSLVVALNTDASARRLGKGADRPLNREADRVCLIAALASVDLVTWFDEDTPLQLIESLRPDLLVKGGDYDMATLPETQAMARWGGTALAIPFLSGFSTTALVQKIRQNR